MNRKNGFVQYTCFVSLAFVVGSTLSCKSELSTKPIAVSADTPSTVAMPEVTPKPTSAVVYLNSEGWHVPVPPDLAEGPTSKSRMSLANGNEVDVTIAWMKWSGEYFFNYGGGDAIKKFGLSENRLKLTSLRQLRVGKKVFAYVVMYEKTSSDDHHRSNSGIRHPSLMYKIRDKDGDGKFEELFPGDSDGFVPDWIGT